MQWPRVAGIHIIEGCDGEQQPPSLMGALTPMLPDCLPSDSRNIYLAGLCHYGLCQVNSACPQKLIASGSEEEGSSRPPDLKPHKPSPGDTEPLSSVFILRFCSCCSLARCVLSLPPLCHPNFLPDSAQRSGLPEALLGLLLGSPGMLVSQHSLFIALSTWLSPLCFHHLSPWLRKLQTSLGLILKGPDKEGCE
jgi:hypothetical protein